MLKKTVAVLVLLSLLAWAQGNGAPAPRILIVHMQHVVENCEEAKDAVAELRTEKNQKQKDFDVRMQALRKRAEGLRKKKLSERDPDFLKQIYEVDFQLGKLQAEASRESVKLSDQMARKLAGILKDAKSAAEQVMTQKGGDYVLVSRVGPISLESEKDLTGEYVGRRVLAWKDPAANITKDVVDLMNDWYKKRQPPDTQPDKDAAGG